MNNMEAVGAIVHRLQADGRQFTLKDVLKGVRQQGLALGYSQTKMTVGALWDAGKIPGYLRTLVPIEKNLKQYVYHPLNTVAQKPSADLDDLMESVKAVPGNLVEFFKRMI